MGMRIENALVACGGYLAKAAVPVGLAVAYPYKAGLPLGQVALSALLLVAMVALGVLWLKERPYVFVGFAWFITGLFPVIGIVQAGPQPSADRYTYVPLVGIFLATTWVLADQVLASRRARGVLAAAALGWLAILSGLTWVQTRYWKNSITLFERTLSVMPDNAVGHCQIGVALDEAGKLDEAKEHLKIATRLEPDQKEAWALLGNIFLKQGNSEEAERCYEWVLHFRPRQGSP